LNFIKFETEKIDECIDFIGNLVVARKHPSDLKNKVIIKATGGGAHKFYDSFTKKLKEVIVEKEDEMECLITGKILNNFIINLSINPCYKIILGLNFLIAEIPYEVFTYSEFDPMCFEDTPIPSNMFPYMVVF
jgi:pantothenate kinase